MKLLKIIRKLNATYMPHDKQFLAKTFKALFKGPIQFTLDLFAESQ